MRIAFFTDVYHPTINGVVISIDAFADNLRSKGHEVTIICPSYPDTEEDDNTIRVSAITFPTYKEYRMAAPISAKIEKHMKEHVYDLIHIHSPFAVGLSGMFYARRFRLPIVYTAHTNYADYRHYVHGGMMVPEIVIDKLAARFSNGIDLTIAPSKKIADSLVRYGTTTSIAILPTGVPRATPGDRAAFKQRFSLDRVVNFLYLGRVTKEKNMDFLIRSFHQAVDRLHPKSKLVIAGDGPYRADLELLVGELELTDRVVFTGFLSGQDRADAYEAADIFCHASYSETQGMTLLEASSYGLPLVVCDDSAYDGVAIDGSNALLSGPNESDYANQLVRLATNTDLRKAYRVQARKIARQYDITAQTDKLIKLYSQTIADKRLTVVYSTE